MQNYSNMAINQGTKPAGYRRSGSDEKELQVEADDIDDNEDDEDTGDHVYPPYQPESHGDKQPKKVIINKSNRNRSQIESRRRLDAVSSLVLKATTNSRNARVMHSSSKPDSPKLMKDT